MTSLVAIINKYITYFSVLTIVTKMCATLNADSTFTYRDMECRYAMCCCSFLFSEEQISAMRKELEKYGIQMPAFSKIGGILESEVYERPS